jgi:hypothetical protein
LKARLISAVNSVNYLGVDAGLGLAGVMIVVSIWLRRARWMLAKSETSARTTTIMTAATIAAFGALCG